MEPPRPRLTVSNESARNDARWYLSIAAAYLAGLAALGVALRHNVGFPLDDSWIHQVIARNLVQHHSFGFTPGVTSSGSSSTLWSLVLAIDYLLFTAHSPVLFPLILNAILMTLSGGLLWRMAALDGLPVVYGLALAVLPALSGNYVWLAFIGMEHMLFVTLSLATILLWFYSGAASALATGVALGVLGMTRPEGLALSVLLFALYRWCGRSVLDVLRAGAVAAVFVATSFAINLKTSGSLLPMTLRGRRFLFGNSDKLHVGRSTVRGLTMETYAKVIQHNFFHTTRGWAMVAVGVAFYGCFVLLRRFPNRTAVLVLWATLHYASYCLTLPATGHGGRYQPFVLLLFPSLMAIAMMDVIGWVWRLGLPRVSLMPSQAMALVVVSAVTAATLPRWSFALGESIDNIDNCHLKMAEYLDTHFPTGTKMGVFDIGTIGYFSHIDVVDLGGLVDRNYLPYLVSGQVPEYLEAKGVGYVILPHNGPEGVYDGTGSPTRLGDLLRFFHNPAVRLEEVHTEGIDYGEWFDGYVYTQHAYQFQTLYRIIYLNTNQELTTDHTDETRIRAAETTGIRFH